MAHAFGLEIRGADGLEGLVPGPGPDPGRFVGVHVTDHEPDFPEQGASEHSGVSGLSIRSHPSGGWRISVPDFGVHVLSADGQRLETLPPPGRGWRWQRLLFAQVLPLACVLQGVEVLHASAVAVDGGVIALVGGSGQGKSTVAAALIARGAAFVTDDALAVEPTAEVIMAHPGPRFAQAGPGDTGPFHEPDGAAGALPLTRVHILDRAARHARPDAEPYDRALPTLLAAAFVPYVSGTTRQGALLDVASAIAAAGTVQQLRLPERADPDAVARLVLEDGRARRV